MGRSLLSVGATIVILEFFERVAYFTFAGSQRNNLERQFGYGTSDALAINAVFGVLAYTTVFIGGYVADTLFGRFKAILFFFAFYLVGAILTSVAVLPTVVNAPLYLVGALVFVALGAGASKPSISTFGADQFDPSEGEQKARFFTYFYAAIMGGAAIANGALTTIAVGGTAALPYQKGNTFIPAEYGFFSAYIISTISLIIGTAVFLLNYSNYTKLAPEGNPFAGAIYYIWEGAKTSVKGKVAFAGWVSLSLFIIITVTNSLLATRKVKAVIFVSLGLVVIGIAALVYAYRGENEWADRVPPHPQNHLTLIEAKGLFSIVPVVTVTSLGFQTAGAVIGGQGIVQACHMDLRVGGGQFNATFFIIFLSLTIIVASPLLYEVVYPFVGRLQGKKEASNAVKISIGLGASFLGVLILLILEFARKNAPLLPAVPENISLCAGSKKTPVVFSDISSFYVIIPLSFTGIAATAIMPTLLYFTYSQCPPRARSVAQAYNLFSQTAVTDAVVAALTNGFQSYLPNNLNNGGHVEYIYYVMLGLIVISFAVVLWLLRQFTPRTYDNELAEGSASSPTTPQNDTEKNLRPLSGSDDGKVYVTKVGDHGVRGEAAGKGK